MPSCLLPVYIEACVILPLRFLDAYPTHRHPGYSDTGMGGPYHCDDSTTVGISRSPWTAIYRASPPSSIHGRGGSLMSGKVPPHRMRGPLPPHVPFDA